MRFSRSAEWLVEELDGHDYPELEAQMMTAVEAVLAGGADRLLLCEPAPVLTVGRGARIEDYAAAGLPVVPVSRGGKTTFHGPGQLVIWPVIALHEEARDLHAYLHALEEGLIRGLARLGLAAGRDPRNTGVWVGGRKLASIGVAVRRWVAYHGVALNVSTELSWFRRFDPCGLEPELMSNLEVEMAATPDPEAVRQAVLAGLTEALRGEPQA